MHGRNPTKVGARATSLVCVSVCRRGSGRGSGVDGGRCSPVSSSCLKVDSTCVTALAGFLGPSGLFSRLFWVLYCHPEGRVGKTRHGHPATRPRPTLGPCLFVVVGV